MSKNQVIVDEQILIDLCADATITRHMLEFLTANIFRVSVPKAEREAMLDGLRQSMQSFEKMKVVSSERDAIMASDIAMRSFEIGAELVENVRGYLAKDG